MNHLRLIKTKHSTNYYFIKLINVLSRSKKNILVNVVENYLIDKTIYSIKKIVSVIDSTRKLTYLY